MNRSTRNEASSPVAVPAVSHARSFTEKTLPRALSYTSLPNPTPNPSPTPVSARAPGESKRTAPAP
ncbi:hypothetical protein COEX109129_40250 [Corallococcus exiguus]